MPVARDAERASKYLLNLNYVRVVSFNAVGSDHHHGREDWNVGSGNGCDAQSDIPREHVHLPTTGKRHKDILGRGQLFADILFVDDEVKRQIISIL